jgi:hypothetical protein
MAPSRSVTVHVQPRGESGLAVSFVAAGRRVTHAPEGYFEATGGYVVEATVDSTLGVGVRSRFQ